MEMKFRIIVLAGILGLGLAAGQEPQVSYQVQHLLTASSPSDSRSKEWKPGDGLTLEVSGMAWMGKELALSIRKGEVWIVENPLAENPEDLKFRLFASGLHEPLGLAVDGDDLLVSQRAEITRLQDSDGDGVADAYLTECDGWNVSGNYHAYSYGPERDGEGNLWVTLNLGMGQLADNSIGWRGWGGIIGGDGRFQPKAMGMRSPSGLGANLDGDMFYTDQQGTWIPASPVYHLRPGVFFGNQESLGTLENPNAPFQLSQVPKPNQPYPKALRSVKEFVPPAVWLPYNKLGRSTTDIEVIPEGEAFGPFGGQLLVGEFTNSAIQRVFLEKVDGEYQGACFPFLDGFPAAVVRLSFGPDGSLFVGMTNRGWSSLGNRSYGLSRVTYQGEAPFAIQEMKARPTGFELLFTHPIDPESVKSDSGLSMTNFTYEYSSSYGGEEIDTQANAIRNRTLSEDGKTLVLEIEGLRELYVHELHLDGIRSRSGESLSQPRAYYTLNRIPKP